MELGEQIKEARESAGLSQEQLAVAIGVSKQSVIWWESDTHVPSKARLKKMEAIFNTRLYVTGSSMPDIPDVPPKIVKLAMEISKLTEPQRKAVGVLIKGLLVGNKKKLGVK